MKSKAHSRLIETGPFWQKSVANSHWHFDPSRYEELNLQKIQVPYLNELISLSVSGIEKTISTSLQHASENDLQSKEIKDGISKLAKDAGYSGEMVYSLVNDFFREGHPVASELGSSLGLDDSYVKIHLQRPGQVWPLHIDNFHAFRARSGFDGDLERVKRFSIALNDWCWGQMFQIGNVVWTGWEVGDCAEIPFGFPHGSANSSPLDRISLIITGVS
jgi:hypothetical protein